LFSRDDLKNLLHQPGLKKTQQLLICLGVEVEKPKRVQEIKDLGIDAGIKSIKSWNVTSFLNATHGKAISTREGWELSGRGKEYVAKLVAPLVKSVPLKTAASLRGQLAKIRDPETSAFVEEAIRCCEHGLYRAAVVLSWVGAVSVLYDHVLRNKLSDFNSEARNRDKKWKDARSKDDLANMKESKFLEVLVAISVLGKSVKKVLEARLDFRNGCGHPSSLMIGEAQVNAHIEALILNIFARFSV